MFNISILMPVYNTASYLLEALKSLFKQTVNSWELIIVDDGSSDDSAAIVRSITDRRIRLLSISHQGLVPALNLGLKYCQGDWVVRMDADDICHPKRLELLLSYTAAWPEVEVWGSTISVFPRPQLKDGMLQYEGWLNSLRTHADIRNNLFVECPIAHPSLMVKREAIMDIGGYRDRGWPEDYDLIFRLFQGGYRFSKIPQSLLFWRYHPHKTSLNDPRYDARNFFGIKYEYFKQIFQDKRDFIIIGFADNGKAWLKALLADGFSVKYIVDLHPGRIGHKMLGVPVIHPDELKESGFFISTASANGARNNVREWLAELGFTEWDDFICVA